jgi:hypothetical protein
MPSTSPRRAGCKAAARDVVATKPPAREARDRGYLKKQ